MSARDPAKTRPLTTSNAQAPTQPPPTSTQLCLASPTQLYLAPDGG